MAYLYSDQNPIVPASEYPYTAMDGTRSYNQKYGEVAANGFTYSMSGSPFQMQAAVMKGPIAVSIDADSMYFNTYQSGILTDYAACGTALDHAVTVVGFSSVDVETPYWIVQNSWGADWGD